MQANEEGILPRTPPSTQNYVLTCDFGAPLAMRFLSLVFRGQMNLKRFAAAIIRLSEPHCTGLFFSSGRVVCTGCKSKEDARVALHKLKNLFELVLDLELRVDDLELRNIVCSRHLGYAVDLHKLHADAKWISAYDPELFPGFHLFCWDLETMLKLFSSGSLIVTGIKSLAIAEQSFLRADKLFSKYWMSYRRSHDETRAMVAQRVVDAADGKAPIAAAASFFDDTGPYPHEEGASFEAEEGKLPDLDPEQLAAFYASPFNVFASMPPPPSVAAAQAAAQESARRRKEENAAAAAGGGKKRKRVAVVFEEPVAAAAPPVKKAKKVSSKKRVREEAEAAAMAAAAETAIPLKKKAKLNPT